MSLRNSGRGLVTGCLSSGPGRTFGLFLVLCLLCSCSIPKFIVYKDTLSPEEHINLGVSYEKRGEYDLAISQYREAASKLPIAYFYLGNACFKKGDYDSAEDYYRESIRLNPEHADSYNNLAWLYYSTNRNLKEAKALVERAIRLNPSKRDVYFDTLKRIEERLGQR